MSYNLKNLAADLQDATITYTGETITIMFRSRDRLTPELKKSISLVVNNPIHFIFQSKQGFKQEWWLDGFSHNPFGGAALQSVTDTDYLEHHYNEHGWAQCDYGPARIEHRYGKSYREDWITTNGKRHREDGPASIDINYGMPTATETNFDICQLHWYQNGIPFNNGLWTSLTDVARSEETEVTPTGFIRTLYATARTLRWHDEENGNELHRVDGPARLEFRNFKEIEKTGNKSKWQWEDWHGEWHIHGDNIPYRDILDWSKKNQILMWNEPCYDRSAFRTPEGEFLFLTDFIGA